jgi:DNA-binding transcriptional LysR family regulator
MRPLDLVNMRLFVAVAEEENMSRAAARERIALAALSKRITKLEKDLKVPLFERKPRGVKLTSAGYAFLQHARPVIFAMRRLDNELRDYASGVRGYVRVAANTSAMTYYLPGELGAFMRTQPAISIELQERSSAGVVSAITDGIADIGIFSSSVIPLEQLTVFPYRKDRLVLVTPQKHPLAKYREVELRDALAFDFIGLDRASAIHAVIARESNALGSLPKLRGEVRSFETICRLIQHAVGIGILPEVAVTPHLESMGLKKIKLLGRWGQRELMLGVRDVKALTPSAQLLLNGLRKDGENSVSSAGV